MHTENSQREAAAGVEVGIRRSRRILHPATFVVVGLFTLGTWFAFLGHVPLWVLLLWTASWVHQWAVIWYSAWKEPSRGRALGCVGGLVDAAIWVYMALVTFQDIMN